MNNEEVRCAALDFALRFPNSPLDLEKLFGVADQFAEYIRGAPPSRQGHINHAEMAELKNCSTDPVPFTRHLVIDRPGAISPTQLELYPFQEALIRHVHQHRFSVINHARQMGISTTLCAYVLWSAIFKSNQTILFLSPKLALTQEKMSRILLMVDYLPAYMRPEITTRNKTEIRFANGSRILGRAAKPEAGCGMSVNLLLIDEAAYVSHRTGFELWASLMPVVASAMGTRCIFASSARDTGGFFYQCWQQATNSGDRSGSVHSGAGVGSNGFAPLMLPWDAHPERDEAWARNLRKDMGEKAFASDYECVFSPWS